MISKSLVGTTVCVNLLVRERLGVGSFGEIYDAQSKTNPKDRFAIKFEDANNRRPQLFHEAKLYKLLAGNIGVPRVYAVTTELDKNLMVLQLLGQSIQDIFQKQGKRMELKSVLMIGMQMIERVQLLHKNGYLHRDIKPDNFLVGLGKQANLIYMIDLGLAKRYIQDGKHIPYKTNKELTGTARYASLNTHMGYEQARRDDIEGIAYVLIYLAKGILPWQNLKIDNKKDKYKAIMDKKLSTPADVLCRGLPQQFVNFIEDSKKLKFQEEPNYQHFKKLLTEALVQADYKLDWNFEWIKSNSTEHQQLPSQAKQKEISIPLRATAKVASVQKQKRATQVKQSRRETSWAKVQRPPIYKGPKIVTIKR